jgi:SulP family sulfate permease
MQLKSATGSAFSRSIVHLISCILKGGTIGITIIFACVSFAALIYSGTLQDYFPLGVKFILAGSIIVTIVTALFSSLPIAIALAQSDSMPVYAIMASTLATTFATQHLSVSPFPTILFTICLATSLSGVIFLIVGYLKLGNLICFMPYPVIGGFLAGIGWLLFFGTFSVLLPAFDHTLAYLFTPAHCLLWIPAIAYAIILLILSKKTQHPLLLPLCLIVGFIVFYVIVYIKQIPLQTLHEQGFLFNIAASNNPSATPLSAFHDFSFHMISWHAVATQISNIATISLLCTIAMLLYETGLEVALKKEINFNRELYVTGWGNLLSGLVGGLAGYTSVSITILNHEMQKSESSNSRLPGLFCAAMCFIALLFGVEMLSYFPRFIVGGLLMFFGLSFLKHWIFDVRKTLPLFDYLLILSILLVIALIGMLQGIFLGIIVSVIFFIVNYSHTNTIKCILNGDYLQSNKQRDPVTQKLLTTQGKIILYFQLQNYLFFGNANFVLQKLREIVSKHAEIHYLIYDFHQLVGLDSSVMMSFEKIKQLAISHDIIVILTEMNSTVLSLFQKNHFIDEPVSTFRYIPAMDDALAWCEESIITQHACKPLSVITLQERLSEFGIDKKSAKEYRIDNFFEKISLQKDNYLFKQNDESTEIYFI